jgi:hypothetical protein
MLKLPHKHLIFPMIKVYLFGEFFPWVFCQFCDIKNLGNFSKKLAKLLKFTLDREKIPIKFQLFCAKHNKICLEKTYTHMLGPSVFIVRNFTQKEYSVTFFLSFNLTSIPGPETSI